MSRLIDVLKANQSNNRTTIIPFVTAGDPIQKTDDILHGLVAGGADVLELGLPFSDPAADGPVIQKASERSITNGTHYSDVFNIIQRFREKDIKTPIILMGYLNVAETHPNGFAGFCKEAKQAGADGFIWVDLSFESGASYRSAMAENGLHSIPLIAPTTSKTRLKAIVESADAFVYYVSVRGVTGDKKQSGQKTSINQEETQAAVLQIKDATNVPVAIGFGIKDAETAKKMAELSDAIVIGSALVARLYEAASKQDDVVKAGQDFISKIRRTLDA